MARNAPNKPSKHRHNPRDNINTTRATQATRSSTASSSGQPRPACSSQRNSHLAPQRPAPSTSTPERERQPRQTSLDCSSSSSSPGSSRDASRSESPHLTPIPRPQPSESPLRCLEPLNLHSALQAGNSESGRKRGPDDDLMTKIEAFFERQKEFNERLEQRVTDHLTKEREDSRAPRNKRLPKELSGNVREVYGSLTGADGQTLEWDFSKSSIDLVNKVVNGAIMAGVRSTDPTTPTDIIRAAIRAHFRTKKKQAKIVGSNRQKEVLKEQRKRSRKNTKRLRRVKALRESTSFLPEEKERYLACLTIDFMSSEESASDQEEHPSSDVDGSDSEPDERRCKRLCIKPLPWRSTGLNGVMARLDRKIARRRSQRGASMVIQRVEGPPSNWEAPEDAPEFAVTNGSR